MRLIQINGVLLGSHVCVAVTLILEKTMRPLTTDDRLHDCSLLMFVHVGTCSLIGPDMCVRVFIRWNI